MLAAESSLNLTASQLGDDQMSGEEASQTVRIGRIAFSLFGRWGLQHGKSSAVNRIKWRTRR
jgi:hypothetical protein